MEAVPQGATMPPDEDRFRTLYRDHYADVFAYCRRRVSSDQAEVVTAETFLVAWRKLDDVPGGDSALAWLYGVAYRMIGHQWRGSRRRRRLNTKLESLGVETVTPPDTQFLSREERSMVMRAVDELNPAEIEILRLALWEELPAAEVAVALGISVDATRQRLSRAKKALTRAYNRLEASFQQPTAAQRGGGR